MHAFLTFEFPRGGAAGPMSFVRNYRPADGEFTAAFSACACDARVPKVASSSRRREFGESEIPTRLDEVGATNLVNE